ncbi:MAG: InlB B-repeat-containing protein, partial [Oscillospiraceae bacterium]|nr:InlB B-repeat-containing protein [Oscillospiraceae bacterium]
MKGLKARLLPILLIAIFLLQMTPPPASAADTGIRWNIPHVNSEPGAFVDLRIPLTENPNPGFSAMTILIGYDAAVLTPQGTTALAIRNRIDIMDAGFTIMYNPNPGGYVGTHVLIQLTPEMAGSIFRGTDLEIILRFQVRADAPGGTSPVTYIGHDAARSGDPNPIPFATPGPAEFGSVTLPGGVVNRTISYMPNGGTGAIHTVTVADGGAHTVRTPASAGIAASDPVRYEFAGWSRNSDGSGTRYFAEDMFEPVTSDVQLYAQWAVRTFGVSFLRNDGTAAVHSAAIVAYNELAARPTDPVRTGWIFDGVWLDEDGNVFHFDTPITAGRTLRASWTRISYTVTFLRNDGTAALHGTPVAVYHGDTVTIPQTPDTWMDTGLEPPERYSFVHWLDETSAAFDFSTPIVGNRTLHAEWIKIPPFDFRVNFARNDGTGALHGAPALLLNGDTVPRPEDPEREGYTFVRWIDEVGAEFDFGTQLYEVDRTLRAEWLRISYTVTFQRNDGTAALHGAPVSVYHGDLVTRPANPTRTGYSFVRWMDESDVTFVFTTPITTNRTLRAEWLPEYLVTFQRNDGTGAQHGSPVTVVSGQTVARPADPTRAGYNFVRWIDETNAEFVFTTA